MNPMECDLISGLHAPGQMVFTQGQFSKKLHLHVDSVTHWMAVNDAEANLRRREFFDRYGIADGLHELANRFPFVPRQMRGPNSHIPQGAAA